MKIKNNIFVLYAFLALFVSCKENEEYGYNINTGTERNAITLMAGISEGGAKLQTRAGEDLHVPFSATTQMRLYVEGTWTGKTNPTITQYTNCTTKAATSKYDGVTNEVNDIHPLGSYTPMLYWDDYGTADPNNTTSRANGLAVYGVAVEGLSTLPNTGTEKLSDITGDSWTSLTWSVKTDGTDVLSKDIIVSNNHGDNSASDRNGIKFEQRTDDPANANYKNNILEYKHMMSKVTFVLTAGAGFTNNKFSNAPEVTLTRNKTGENNTEWCITSGTVNIKSATAQGAATPVVARVKQQVKETTTAGVVTEHALIYPGSCFGTSDDDVIARINADGNIFYVTAKAIRDVIASTHTDYKTKSGYNYVIKVTIDKTEIHVTATVADWTEVEAQAETPKINVDKVYGHPTQDGHPAFVKDFDLFRSTSIDGSFKGDGDHSVVSYVEAESKYTLTPQLYWPNHQTHYFFRGVWPRVDSKDAEDLPIGPTSTQVSTNAIDIKNVSYKKGYYPSDLMIGSPLNTNDKTLDETCKVHTSTKGICATEGNVHINFRYVMSQIEVHLETATAADGEPTPANAVNLTNAKVEIVNGYTTGKVSLGAFNSDGSFKITDLGNKDDFTLAHVDGEDANYRHSAIVPQDLTYMDSEVTKNLRFKITIYKSGSTTEVDDIYYADIAPIEVQEKQQGGTYGDPASIDKWESGKHYIYTLTLSKTAIKVTATITDWKEVKASQNIWF